MAICYQCDKGVTHGRSHTHKRGVAGGRWKKKAPKTLRLFKPNLQPMTILEGKIEKHVKLCTNCIKRAKKDVRDGNKPLVFLKQFKIAEKKQ